MRPLILSLALLPLFALPARAATADEQAITEKIDAFQAAWNKDDAKAMAACWTEDGTLINPFGRIANGQGAVQMLFEDEHTHVFKGSTYQRGELKVQMVSADVAVADMDSNITNIHGPDGNASPDFKHHVALVMVKKDGAWQIAACRPYQLSQKPTPPAATP